MTCDLSLSLSFTLQTPVWPVSVLRTWSRGGFRSRAESRGYRDIKLVCPKSHLLPQTINKSLCAHQVPCWPISVPPLRGGHITRLVAINRIESTTEGRNTTSVLLGETGSRIGPRGRPPTPGPACGSHLCSLLWGGTVALWTTRRKKISLFYGGGNQELD